MSLSHASRLGWAPIAESNPELWSAMESERRRQHDKIELIASARTTSSRRSWRPRAPGSPTSTPRACPGKRYYGGCEFVDIAERLARERALELFPGAEHVNVQPHSGAQANMAAYFAVARAGRPGPGHEPRPRRPPDPRLAGQLLGPAVRDPRRTASREDD